MNDNDFKKLVEESLKALTKRLDNMGSRLDNMGSDLTEVKKGLYEVKKNLQNVKDIQENRVLPSVIYIETNIKGYADAYKTNKANIERLDIRMAEIENKEGIIPPPEFTIQR